MCWACVAYKVPSIPSNRKELEEAIRKQKLKIEYLKGKISRLSDDARELLGQLDDAEELIKRYEHEISIRGL